jgi:hypothetical protein
MLRGSILKSMFEYLAVVANNEATFARCAYSTEINLSVLASASATCILAN